MARVAEAFIGARFDRLIVIAEPSHEGGRYPRVNVRCDCGTEKNLRVSVLGVGTKSCGCLGRETAGEKARTHGMRNTSEYNIWTSMKQRCHNPNFRFYANYGGRGISVCERWRESFEAFYADMGPRPSKKHTIDRIDNDGGYEPGNCAWSTYKEQAQNKRPQLRATCINGHERTPKNVRVRPDGAKTCRPCDNERHQADRDAVKKAFPTA